MYIYYIYIYIHNIRYMYIYICSRFETPPLPPRSWFPSPSCGCGPVGSIGSHGSPPLPCEWELGVYSLPPLGHGSALHPVDVRGG